jgi:hypothetical protein
MRNLSIGDRGPDVVALQQGLNVRRTSQEAALVEDGIFGPKTDAAVRRFQQRNALVVDGVVGPKTRTTLFPLAVVTMRAFGMRLREPSLFAPRPDRFAGLMTGGLTLGANPVSSGPSLLPPLTPTFSGYQGQAYPGLGLPMQTPVLGPPPAVPGLRIPVHHFEISPGGSISLGRPLDVSFGLTLSAVIMLGPEDGRHQEFSTGIITSTPGVFQGGDWTVGWFAQLTHVEQLGRDSNWSWQPNAQVVAGHGVLPFLSVTASPANVQVDLNKTISLSFGGPSVTATLNPEGGSLSWGLGSFGVVGKF